MRGAARSLCLLILLGITGSCIGSTEPTSSQSDEWRVATAGWQYSFPRDHGPHREFKTEWWYSTGTLTDESGHDFGFQLTFFRQGVNPGPKPTGSSRFRVHELPFAHFAVTDVSGGTFRHFQKSSRGAFGEAGFSIPSQQEQRMAWIEGWEIRKESPGHFRLKASDSERAIDLSLVEEREPLIHGQNGISPKSSKPGHASHYYSLTRLRATGSVIIDGKTHTVTGLVWFDHEWATNSLASDEAGWDWSGLHLSDGSDLMLFRIRDKNGNASFLSATLRSEEGKVVPIEDLGMTAKGLWKSPHTGGNYPKAFEIDIPSQEIHLTLAPRLGDQELLLPPFAYWEGMVSGTGTHQGAPVTATGYLELTGYGGEIIGVNGK
jgi:predicted secreted hydrolase